MLHVTRTHGSHQPCGQSHMYHLTPGQHGVIIEDAISRCSGIKDVLEEEVFLDNLEEARTASDECGTLGYYKQTTPVKIV